MEDIELIIDSKVKDLGGFQVRRVLPVAARRMVGPFIFFDHMGPVDFKVGQGMDVRPHPHIGLSTLTYLFEGQILHRDTMGFEQLIQPGAVNWMTAGSGIAHSERSPKESREFSQKLHGLQIWIALPKKFEEVKSSFHHHPQKSIPEISSQGSRLRVIAGKFENEKSPVEVFSDLTYFEILLEADGKFEFPNPGQDLAVYLVEGHATVNDQRLSNGQLAVLKTGTSPRIKADAPSRVMILGGKPLEEPRHIWWNFVSSSKDRIEKAKLEWKEQSFGKIKNETEFIPLPEN